MNLVSRKGKFDAAHRVLDENFQCFNLHGHEYHYELTFSYNRSQKIGFPIDFKNIKFVGCKWIEKNFDHGYIANPQDIHVIQVCNLIKSKLYLMHLVDEYGYCNPTAENIAKEIFYAVSFLLNEPKIKLKLVKVKLFETYNCFVECEGLSNEESDFLSQSKLHSKLENYKRSLDE